GQRLETVLRDPLFQTNSGGGVQQGLSRAIEPLVTALLKMPALQRNLLIAIVSGLLVAFMIYSGYRDAPWSIPRYRWTIAGGGLSTTSLVFTLLTYLGAVIDVAGPLLMPGLGALGVLVAVAVAAFVIFGLRRAAGPAGARMAGAFAAEAGWTAGQARTAATEAATAGDYRKAVRYRYLATLLALDESGRLHFDPALTNGELMGKVAPEVREPLRPLVAVFERLWYGGFPATEHEYQAYQAMAAGAEATAAEAAP
ncbi:MAG TPA: DUF4129 domain-containing protein, partial [Chloroflexia bacterium]|nr:DUF4129 domain-containing protein [Chloroflexia bacterium]